MQTRIPCVLMRGGTSKGPYFLASDLPSDRALRDKVLLSVMGSPDGRQIDGLGGANPLTSKVAIVSKSTRPGIDIDYLFAQVGIEEADVDITPNCGNMLAGIGPFAIEQGLIPASGPVTPVRIFMENSSNVAVASVQTPDGRVEYAGDARIDGVPGTSAPISIELLDTAGSACGSLLPTGKLTDVVDGVSVTCIDNGMPVVLIRAADLGRTGYESHKDLDADAELKARLESIRLKVGSMMNLGDVTKKVVPKMCLVAAPRDGGAISTRSFIPHVCHSAIGVLGAVTVATACVLPGSVAYDLARLPEGAVKLVSVEHPTGEFTVEIETDEKSNHQTVKRSALLRTARRLMDGYAYIPEAVWAGSASVASR
ncbi:MAG TPA: 4-oxalomesaconate tautomerase [Alphaproteobacteria bacterium]|jgi:4-oxalomesaconate tautomerase